MEILVIHWEWSKETEHAGNRFWSCHQLEKDGRIRDWPKIGLVPIGATKLTAPEEGYGLELLEHKQQVS